MTVSGDLAPDGAFGVAVPESDLSSSSSESSHENLNVKYEGTCSGVTESLG